MLHRDNVLTSLSLEPVLKMWMSSKGCDDGIVEDPRKALQQCMRLWQMMGNRIMLQRDYFEEGNTLRKE